MRTTFLAFVAAFLMFVGALWLTGCAHQPTTTPVYHGEQVVITVHPWTQATPERVQIVAKTPDPARYVFVGRVKMRCDRVAGRHFEPNCHETGARRVAPG